MPELTLEGLQTYLEALPKEWSWMIYVGIIIFVALFINLIQRRLLRSLINKFKKTRSGWDDVFVLAANAPLTALIWLIALTLITKIVYDQTELIALAYHKEIKDVGFIAIAAWFIVRIIDRGEKNILKTASERGRTLDRTTLDAVTKLLRIVIFILAVLLALQTLGFSLTGVLAFGGIGGIAIGFAAKDLLANFFGGLMIYLDRPFTVGDWIRSPDREIEGTVEYIGWRLTRIRRFDKRPLYVPNAIFASIAVENPSRMTHRRIHETIGIRYQDIGQMEQIVSDVKTMLKQHPDIAIDQTLIVNFNAFNASSVDFFVYTFTKTKEWIEFHTVKQDVLLKIASIIEQNQAEIAFPTRTVHLESETELINSQADVSSSR